ALFCFEGTRMEHNSGAGRRENAASCLTPFIPRRTFRRGLQIRERRSRDMDLQARSSLRAPTMTIDGSIDTRCALDLSAGASYEAHSGTAVPDPDAPYARRNAAHLDCAPAID